MSVFIGVIMCSTNTKTGNNIGSGMELNDSIILPLREDVLYLLCIAKKARKRVVSIDLGVAQRLCLCRLGVQIVLDVSEQ